MTEPQSDPAYCPLCRKDNGCAMVRGMKECWCFDLAIRPETIDRIPDADRGKACICRTCASGWQPPGKTSQSAS